jgi:hypothetical protein
MKSKVKITSAMNRAFDNNLLVMKKNLFLFFNSITVLLDFNKSVYNYEFIASE